MWDTYRVTMETDGVIQKAEQERWDGEAVINNSD